MFSVQKLFLLILSSGIVAIASSQVGISETGTVPDPNAILDISSTTKGFLPPRMTTAQRDQIPNPPNGLQIFNTDCNAINYNAGSSDVPEWVSVIAGN
ncbi:MAG: hypothetical protein IT223_01305 [Crocinitomicaceae bacterium]|nr:hypothetical protein [Crocinitomicaceae bacterium]